MDSHDFYKSGGENQPEVVDLLTTGDSDGDDDEEDSLLTTQFPSTDDAISTFTTKGLKVISINAIKSVGVILRSGFLI